MLFLTPPVLPCRLRCVSRGCARSEQEGRGAAWTEERATREGGASRGPAGEPENTAALRGSGSAAQAAVPGVGRRVRERGDLVDHDPPPRGVGARGLPDGPEHRVKGGGRV